MHLRPHTAQMDDPKVDDPLPPLHTPSHPRTLQTLAEHRLARRLRHPAADRQVIPPVAHVVQVLDVVPQVAVRVPVRLRLTQHQPTAPDRRRRVQDPVDRPRLRPQPPAHLPRPRPCPARVAEQRPGQLVDVLTGMVVVDDPLPLQRLPGTARVPHRLQHPLVILGRVMPRVGDVGQPRQRPRPPRQHVGDQPGQLPRQRPLTRLGHPPQVDRPQPPPGAVVDRERGRGRLAVRVVAADRHEHPVPARGQHRLARPPRRVGLLQPGEHLRPPARRGGAGPSPPTSPRSRRGASRPTRPRRGRASGPPARCSGWSRPPRGPRARPGRAWRRPAASPRRSSSGKIDRSTPWIGW